MAEKNEKEKAVNEQIRDFGQVELEHGEDRIFMLTIIGEIEGHEYCSYGFAEWKKTDCGSWERKQTFHFLCYLQL